MTHYLRYERQVAPPYTVTSADVQEVYRDTRLRDEIRDRFVWTLDLDSHYGVLARSVVLDQLALHDSYGRAYSLDDLRDLGNYWWPKGFGSLSMDHLRDLVQELCDLWVFAPLGSGLYCLRSPNLVRLLGRTDEIENYLMAFVSDSSLEPDDPWRDTDLLHPHLGSENEAPCPLTLGQVRRLWPQHSGVTLVFGSTATGLDHLSQTVAGLAALDRSADATEIAFDLSRSSSSDLIRLIRFERRKTQAESLYVLVALSGDGCRLPSVLHDLLSISDSLEGTRILVQVRPSVLDGWLDVPDEKRTDIETRCGAVTLRAWQEPAIAHWLEERGLAHSGGSTARLVLETTGGYQWLLEYLADRSLQMDTDNVRVLVEDLRRTLIDAGFVERFRSAFELHHGSLAERVAVCASTLMGPDEENPFDTLCELVTAELGEDTAGVVDQMTSLERRGVLTSSGEAVKLCLAARKALGLN